MKVLYNRPSNGNEAIDIDSREKNATRVLTEHEEEVVNCQHALPRRPVRDAVDLNCCCCAFVNHEVPAAILDTSGRCQRSEGRLR